MSISTPFIHRPVATTLLTIAVALSGIIAYQLLPVSPLPQVDFPTINVSASLPGGSPQVMAASVATPLEKMFTRIAGVTEMTSNSSTGSANVTLQFDLSRDINAAARDVQAAINAAAPNLPANLPINPTYRKINPADAPIMIMSMQSDVVPRSQLYDIASSVFAQKLAQVPGVGQVQVGGSSLPAVRVELNPQPVSDYNIGMDAIGSFLAGANANTAKGELSTANMTIPLSTTDQLLEAKDYKNLVVIYRNNSPVRLSDLGNVIDSVEDVRNIGLANGKPSVLGAISGAVAGLVAITPASGFVGPMSALAIGMIAGVVCYLMVSAVKAKFKYDDALDAFGVHAAGGTVGALLTGIFATSAVNPIFKDSRGNTLAVGLVDGNWHQILDQLAGVVIAWVLAIVGSLIILKIVDWLIGLRVPRDQEVQGLDLSLHGEEGYALEP